MRTTLIYDPGSLPGADEPGATHPAFGINRDDRSWPVSLTPLRHKNSSGYVRRSDCHADLEPGRHLEGNSGSRLASAADRASTSSCKHEGRLRPASFSVGPRSRAGTPQPSSPAPSEQQRCREGARAIEWREVPPTDPGNGSNVSVVSYASRAGSVALPEPDAEEDGVIHIRAIEPSPPPSSEEDIASVLARYLAVPLYEVLLPDHLRLRDRSSWADYKNAIVRVCALKGVKHHLRRPYHSAFEAWMKEDELCMALIKLNICDIGRLALPEYVFAADYWESLVALHEKRDVWAERKRRLREEVIKPMVLGMAGWVFVAFVVGVCSAIRYSNA